MWAYDQRHCRRRSFLLHRHYGASHHSASERSKSSKLPGPTRIFGGDLFDANPCTLAPFTNQVPGAVRMALVVYSPLWRHAETLTVRPWWCTALCGHTLHIVNHLFVLLLFRRLQLLLLLQFHCTGTSHSEVPDLPCWKTATLPTPPSSPQMAKLLRRASRRALVKQRWLLNFHRRSVLLRHTQRARHHPPLCLLPS